MNQTDTLVAVLGWASILNIGMLALTALMVMTMRDFMIGIHSKIFGVSEEQLPLCRPAEGLGWEPQSALIGGDGFALVAD